MARNAPFRSPLRYRRRIHSIELLNANSRTALVTPGLTTTTWAPASRSRITLCSASESPPRTTAPSPAQVEKRRIKSRHVSSSCRAVFSPLGSVTNTVLGREMDAALLGCFSLPPPPT